jgi:aminopeptidase C
LRISLITHLKVNKGRSSDVSTQAALFLKLKVQQCWGEEVGKENIDTNRNNAESAFSVPLS